MKLATSFVTAVLAAIAANSESYAQLSLLPGDAAVAPAASNQGAVALARGGNAVLVVWADDRANPYSSHPGSEYETSRDIYGMRFDLSGNPVDMLPIAVFTGRSTQDNPKVVWNGSNWLVAFETYDLGGTGYYYQKSLAAVRVSPAGQVLDAQPIKLHGLVPAGASGWALASDGENWVVVNQGTSSSGDVVAVRISPAGVVLDPPTRSVLPATYHGRSNLQLAYADGVFLLTFNDAYVNGTYDTKAVRFDGSLSPLDAGVLSLLPTPLGALSGNSGGFYIVWNRQEPDFSVRVVGSRLSTAGVKLDGTGVNLSGTKQPYAYATTAVAWDGVNWRVTWGDFSTAYVVRITSAGAVLDPGSVALPGAKSGPTAGTGNGGIQLVWPMLTNSNSDVHSTHVSSANVGTPARVLSIGAPRQLRPEVATNGNGYMLVYHSATASQIRVLARPLDAAGIPLTAEPIQLDAGAPDHGPGYPAVAWNGTVYLIAWGTPAGIVARRLSPDGTLLDASPLVVMSPALGPMAVAALGSDFLVTGRRVGYSVHFIHPVAARVSGAGEVLDASPLVLGHSFVRQPPAVVSLGSRWLVAWIRNVSHNDPLALTMGAFVPAAGTPAAEFQIHGPFSTYGGNSIFEFGLGSNGSQALMVQPQELSSGTETDLLGRFIHGDGTVAPMIVLTPWSGNQYRPRVAWDGTNFIIVYQDQKNRLAPWTMDQLDARSDLFGMRIRPNGTIVDPQGFVFSASPMAETSPNITARDGISFIAGSVMLNDARYANYRVAYDIRSGHGPVAVIHASHTAGDIPLNVNFNSAGSTGVTYAWDFGNGTTSTLANPSHTYSVAGEYRVTLTMTDGTGVQTTQAVMINATKPNQIPVAVARANKTSGNAPLAVIFYADGSYDPDGFIGNFEWVFSDGASYWGSTAYRTFTATGPQGVTLRCYDARGGVGTTHLTINVEGVNKPPVAQASATPSSGSAPLPVQFSSAGSSDPDGSIVRYKWTFGDAFGTYSYDANPSYTYGYAGTYTATLTVTDNNNVSSSATVAITVGPDRATTLRSTAVDLSASLQGKKVSVSGNVTVKDLNGTPVSGASVKAIWRKPDGSTVSQSATTGTSGAAKFSTTGSGGTYTLTVGDIYKYLYSFDAAGSLLSNSITR